MLLGYSLTARRGFFWLINSRDNTIEKPCDTFFALAYQKRSPPWKNRTAHIIPMVNVNVQTGLIPPQCSSVKRLGLLSDCYISVCIRNCRVLNFSEFDEKWRGTKYRDIMKGGLSP